MNLVTLRWIVLNLDSMVSLLTAKVRPKKDNKVWPNDNIRNNALYVPLKSDLDFKQSGLQDRFVQHGSQI
jgi:hypothetical protein